MKNISDLKLTNREKAKEVAIRNGRCFQVDIGYSVVTLEWRYLVKVTPKQIYYSKYLDGRGQGTRMVRRGYQEANDLKIIPEHLILIERGAIEQLPTVLAAWPRCEKCDEFGPFDYGHKCGGLAPLEEGPWPPHA
jgi:hypothetical protein